MVETLEVLELRRKELYQELIDLGDFRRGTISTNYRKCGKKNCVCTQAEHPGHGPQYLWNATVGGKSKAKNLELGPELEKVAKEVENYRAFIRMCEELAEVNEKICALRPVRRLEDEEELEDLKKNCGGGLPGSGEGNSSFGFSDGQRGKRGQFGFGGQ